MSVQQMKDCYAALAAYLNRDTEGLRLLKAYKDAVNELRTSRAAADARAAEAQALADAAVQRQRAAEAEIAEAEAETQRLGQVVENYRRRVQELSEQVEKFLRPHADAPADEVVAAENDSDEVAQMRAVIRRLRSRLKYCPTPGVVQAQGQHNKQSEMYSYAREAFATGWSHADLWTLGASVALLVAFHGDLVLTTGRRICDIPLPPGRGKADIAMSAWGRLVEWLSRAHIEVDPADRPVTMRSRTDDSVAELLDQSAGASAVLTALRRAPRTASDES